MTISAKHIVARFTCWLLLLQLINISIDPPDLKQTKKVYTSQQEDLTINEVESVYELIAEGVFHSDVPENNDHDIDTDTHSVDLYFYDFPYSSPALINHPLEHHVHYLTTVTSINAGPNAPPPKYA
ncbi:hypothetical protein EXU57_15125 [Segetibacter sp. 3557_3]|uniref:hypothetical protein n=1 Tax=Segetibacter sp. 3557_3 TaxID=2547429 RepID=UPI0010585273|nr:hypothetical protein [Segetibacter sp. 3557_3]TDH24666.1 hypothetical protein EXU57_15125 [Segetibacter sp. 3557_3]